ncbi:hypothetical protein [uncultured Dokdonia sp.]|uniref:hypothetical protein n=1 Tax=uncultured Dokdonia sp. TaxID=575653 RepID=UPI0026124DBC|nr:hypothetical protein [uncultured Dokdonia sp.]
MRNTFLILLLLFSVGTIQSQTPHEKEEKIRSEMNELFQKQQKKCYNQVDAITDIHGKTEFWSICTLENGYRILKIASYKGETYYQEIYFEKDHSLIYAKETENYIPKNHFLQIPWYCQFYAKDGKLLTYISHGHGKTETDTWNPEVIFEMYDQRIAELENINK